MTWLSIRLGRSLPVVLVAVVLAVAAVAAGCGDGADDAVDGGGSGAEATATPTESQSPAPDAGLTTYTNDDFGFSLSYDPARFGVFEEMPEGSGLGILIADESQETGPAAIRISVVPIGDGQTTYEPGSDEAMEVLRGRFDGIGEDLSGAQYGDPQECTLGGVPALCAAVEGPVPALPIDGPLTGRLYGTVWGDTVMLVFTGAPSAAWSKAEGPLTAVVDSIDISTAAD